MRKLALALGLWVGLAGALRAQPSSCAGCLLSVYDDAALTRVTGTVSPLVPKTVYLGLRMDASMSGSSLRFEASYPPGFTVLETTSYIANTKLESTGSGGVQVVWPQCLAGTQRLFRIRAITFGSVRDGVVRIHGATLAVCANPTASPIPIPGGCFVLNPSGRSTGCSTPVQPSCWGGVKELFR
jgi:hypothetical protein